jgi:hypothetical protein
MINMFKHILKPKSLVLWIVLFTLIIWTYTFYSLTAFTDVLNEHHSSILGKCLNNYCTTKIDTVFYVERIVSKSQLQLV